MLDLRIRFDNKAILAALRNAPPEVRRELGKGISRAAQEVAREEKRNAPKAHSTLTNSIRVANMGSLERMVGPTVGYAESVVDDISNQPMPPVQSILDWIRVSGIEPNSPGMDAEDLAFVISRSIKYRGTRGNSFIEDTHKQMSDRVQSLLMDSAHKALKRQGLI